MGTSVRQQRDKENKSWLLNGEGDNYPIYFVSWHEVQEFIKRLNARTGENFRLPTEAEWEFAARGGNRSWGYKYSGGNSVGEVAWYDDNSDFHTHPVGRKQANELGLYDMSGNVHEWVQDWYEKEYSSATRRNPRGPQNGSYRVFRGGYCYGDARYARVSDRDGGEPGGRGDNLGFRLARGPN